MYISKELIFKIAYIAISVIHIVLYLILFYKLHKLKGGKGLNVTTIKNKVIDFAKIFLSPENSIISGIKDIISKYSNEDDKPEGGENG